MQKTITPIAHIRSEFPTKFGIPRQSGLVPELRADIVFEPEFAVPEAVRGLADFSHLWLIWGFSAAEREGWSPTVRPPRLGGNTRMGVFATRSPFRPNGLGLSSVRIEAVETVDGVPVVRVSGADLMNGTPIYDIKPYLTTTDCHPEAHDGFVGEHGSYGVTVVLPDELAPEMPASEREALRGVLAQDPRPAFHNDPARVYGFPFGDYEVKFRVEGDVLTVVSVDKRL